MRFACWKFCRSIPPPSPPRGIKFWALQYLPYVELLQPLWLRDEIIESIGKNKYLK